MHIMIDLETLSTSSTAVVTQLGWAAFDPRGDGIVASGCYHLDVQAQIDKGMTVDWSTIQWWLKQDAAAREMMYSDRLLRELPSHALKMLDRDILWEFIDGVWSHGATFDLVILKNLYKRAGSMAPWNFRKERDTRTLFDLVGPALSWAPNAIKHSAEHDAIAQALTVQSAMKMISVPYPTRKE